MTVAARACIGVILAAGVLIAALASHARSFSEPDGDLARFRALRSEAVAAAGADDLTGAAERLAGADALIPNHPGVMILQARIAATAGDAHGAMAHLSRYAAAGLAYDVERDPALSSLSDRPDLASLAARLTANRDPVGDDRVTLLAEIEEAVLVESIVRDVARGRWLVSLVRGRAVLALDDAGAASPFLTEAGGAGGMMGLAVDRERDLLWATSAPAPPATFGRPAQDETSTLLKIDLATGDVLARYPAPTGDGEHALGDLALGPDGTVYVSDSTSGDIFVLRPGAATLEVLVPSGRLGSPQGLVVADDGDALIVADYSSGLHRVSLPDGQVARLSAPADASLIGVDGLVRHGRVLYAVQNGVRPQRVLRLAPDADWTRLETVETVVANLDGIDEPTTGVVYDGDLVFVARSQWSAFGRDGAPTTETVAPARIVRLSLN